MLKSTLAGCVVILVIIGVHAHVDGKHRSTEGLKTALNEVFQAGVYQGELNTLGYAHHILQTDAVVKGCK